MLMSWQARITTVAAVLSLAATARPQGCPTTELVSGNVPSNHYGKRPGISLDGRYVSFISSIPLAAGSSTWLEVYVFDRTTGGYDRVSAPPGGGHPDGHCSYAGISPDGNCVIFLSNATNLVADDTNGKQDVFVHDRTTGITERVNVDSSGAEADDFSDNHPALSFDGRYAVFSSYATNLVANDTNGWEDVFLHDRQTGTTEIVSIATDGTQADKISWWSAISHDARYVVFNSQATTFDPADPNSGADVYLRDRQAGTTTAVSLTSSGSFGEGGAYATISGDGRFVAFTGGAYLDPNDNNGVPDVFVKDLLTGVLTRISLDDGGNEGNGISYDAWMSADGTAVAFCSFANNLVPGDTNGWDDVFLHDLATSTVERMSVATDGSEADSYSGEGQGFNCVAIDGDGSHVVFASTASNLVPNLVPWGFDIYVRARSGRAPSVFCTAKPGLACGLPTIGSAGTPSASATSGFVISAGPARQNKSGLLIYGNTGSNNVAFQGGTLCVRPPVRRTTTVSSGGATLCGGTFAIDMNAFAAGNLGGNPQAYLLQAGSKVTCQFWGRDTLATGSFLSDGLIYIVCP